MAFNDVNGNQMLEAGESPLSGVVVSLSSNGIQPAALHVVITTTTDANGAYVFENLDPSRRYILEVTAPAGYALSDANVTTDAVDSDPDPVTGRTGAFDVAVGANNTCDAGLVQLGSVGGLVWNDLNGNSTRDAGEVLLSIKNISRPFNSCRTGCIFPSLFIVILAPAALSAMSSCSQTG